jgi:hypothetical protein
MNDPLFEKPVLFIIFNRQSISEKVFSEIAKLRPTKLYIAADGPRDNRENEVSICEATRQSILKMIDWPCDVKTRFLDKNIGCALAVTSAITWLFEHETEGIILEDDCMPGNDFFMFCQEMLDYYKDDNRVWHISGYNCFDRSYGDGDYFMMKQPLIWGWATWKRAWDQFNLSMPTFEKYKQLGIQDSFFDDWLIKLLRTYHWNKIRTQNTKANKNVWDMPYSYSIMSQAGLCITPNKNLISNLGFGDQGVHATLSWDSQSNKQRESLSFPLKYPTFMVPLAEADRYKLQNLNKYSFHGLGKTALSKLYFSIKELR